MIRLVSDERPTPVMETLEKTPLIIKNKGKGPITSTRNIRRIVQTCFDNYYQNMKNDGLGDDAGHSSMATTYRHIDSDSKDRHQ